MSSLAKTVKIALLSCVVALGAVRTADAAYVVINADPQYGAQLPGVSWRAVGSLYVNDSPCLSTVKAANLPPGIAIDPLTVNLGGLAGLICGDSRILGVQLQFYETATNQEIQTLGMGDFTADLFPAISSSNRLDSELLNFTLTGGALSALTTTLSRPVHFADVDEGQYCFAVELSSGNARVESLNYSNGQCATTVNQRPEEDSTNRLTKANFEFVGGGAFTVGDAPTARTASAFSALPLIVQDVPEPASLALTLAALGAAFGAGGLARRSRG